MVKEALRLLLLLLLLLVLPEGEGGLARGTAVSRST